MVSHQQYRGGIKLPSYADVKVDYKQEYTERMGIEVTGNIINSLGGW